MNNQKQLNIETALNRLNWRFKNQQIKIGESKIIINQVDVDCVDFINKWIEQQKKETINHNNLFAKIFSYALKHEIYFYKDIKFASAKLQQELLKPIEQHYDTIHSELNRLELNKYSESIGIVTDHIESLGFTQAKENEQQELIKKHSNTLQKYILGVWDKTAVYKALNNTITECVNKYKNL